MKKNYYLCFLFAFILLFSVNSCKKEQNINEGALNSKKGPEKSIVQKINYSRFLLETENITSVKLQAISSKSPNSNNGIGLQTISTYNGLTLFTDSIRKISISGHTTYTFPVQQVSTNDIVFRNFIVDVTDKEVNTFLATYTPDTTYLHNFSKRKPGFFSGNVKLEKFSVEDDAKRIQNVKTMNVDNLYYNATL